MNKRVGSLWKNKSLIIEWIFFLATIIGLFWLYKSRTLFEIGRSIETWNHQWEWSTRWYGLLAIYWIEIVLLAFVWDLLWYRLHIQVRTFYNKFSHLWIKKKWLLIRLIRFKYGFAKLRHYMRIAFYFGGSSKNRAEMIDYVVSPTPLDLFKIMFSFILGKASILAGILTLLTFNNSMFSTIQNTVFNIWNQRVNFIWDNFTKLSALVVLVLIIFLWYFISRQGIVRRAVAQANRKKLEEVILLHRKLSHYAIEIILKGSENLEYAIDCYDMLVDYWTYKRFPDTSKVGYSEHLWYRWSYQESEYFQFKDIAEIEQFTEEIENINSPDNKEISRWFSRYKYELNIASVKFLFSRIEKLDRLLFTKNGFEELVKVPEKYSNAFDTDVPEQNNSKIIQEEREFFKKYMLEESIIEGFELIFTLYRYFVVLENMLHIESDKIGRGIRTFTGKE
ncbi:hypothetical protein E8L90_26625 [Brevibacillus antibioticus]|uniref:Uncharacterized protein n=1 Tax=Brevibacillus antibioticus TaxID=2570228 RepID=A0A4U2YE30_9BACL|nr:hypothetical protein [Brevibacillus antibioticus]TKI58685.1 hypothetical protein E8L90_26625 [Brevibacillus antibioticus]